MATEEEKEQIKQIVSVPCKGCGAQLTFDAGKEKLNCQFCGYEQEIPKAKDMVVEKSFSDAINFSSQESGLGIESKTFHCKTCGAKTAVNIQEVVIRCSFCGSENINQEAFDSKIIKPFGVLPFSLVKTKAIDIFKEWIGNGWFHPNNLKNLAQLSKIEGVYIPFWTYDAHTDSNWTADAGYYYYVTVSYIDSKGNRQERQEKRIRWVPASGYYQHWFDDILVIASHGIQQNRIQKIYPFELEKVVNYKPEYLLGWKAEVYTDDVKTGFATAEKIMDDYIYQECAKMIPGDTYRNLRVYTHKYNITFKHILLPVWVAAYQYNGKSYQVVINGQTGKISGEKPLSFWKIFFTVLLVIAIGFILYTLSKK
jgi:DNA-directed RNA polymerase subunit RPC12/RpoP